MSEIVTGSADELRRRRSYEWIHPMSEVLAIVANSGLPLDLRHKHEVLPHRLFPSMVPAGDRLVVLAPGAPSRPLPFLILATKL